VALTSSFWPNLFLLPGGQSADWFQQLAFDYSMVDAVRNHGEYPLWNPYFGGGVPWAGYIANSGLTPISLAIVAVGEVAAIKLLVLATMLFAGYGMYATCREWLGLDIAPSLMAALLFVGCGKLAGELVDGNYVNLALFTLPFFALCFLRLLQRRWLGLLLPVLYMTAFAEAKYAPLVIAGTLLPFALGYRAAASQTAMRVALAWIMSLGAGVAFAAPKLLPLLELMKLDLVNQTSYHGGSGHYTPGTLLLSLVGGYVGEHYLSLGVGLAALALCLVGAILGGRRSLVTTGLLIVVAGFAMGPASPIPFWRVIRALPVLETMNAVGKYFSVSILFFVCVLVAVGGQRILAIALPSTLAKPPERKSVKHLAATACLITAVLAQPLWQNAPRFNGLFSAENQVPSRQVFHHVASRELLGVVDRYRLSTPRILMYDNIRSGVGTVTWYGNMVFPEKAKAKLLLPVENEADAQPGYRGELYCEQVAAHGCAVRNLQLTYNTIRFHVEAIEPTIAVINLNYHPGWTTPNGEVLDRSGLLAVQVPGAYVGQIELRFTDKRFRAGCLILATSALAWFVGGALSIRGRRSVNESAAVAPSVP